MKNKKTAKVLVLGLGNPILTDDGVGISVVSELRQKIDMRGVTIFETSAGGMNLLELLNGFDKAILIDAIQTKKGEAGQVYRLAPEALNSTRHISSPHEIDFLISLELGKKIGMALPAKISIYAIEAADVTTFSEKCTERVQKTIPLVVEMVIKELKTSCS